MFATTTTTTTMELPQMMKREATPRLTITIDELLAYVALESEQGTYLGGERSDALNKAVSALPESEIRTLAKLALERYVRVSQQREDLRNGTQGREHGEAIKLAAEELQRSTSEGRQPDDSIMDRPDKIQRRREYQNQQISMLTVANQRHRALWESLESQVRYVTRKRAKAETRSTVQHFTHLMNDLSESAAAIVSAYQTEGLPPVNDSIFPPVDPRNPGMDAPERQLRAQVLSVALSTAKFRRLFGGS